MKGASAAAFGAIILFLLAAAPAHSAPPAWAGAVVYEIFVRSFQDSNGDGIGDLRGIRDRLDYLSGLGVDAIWLTPIFPSPTDHGYDATDYRQIHPQLGDLAEFRALLDACHRRGIRVLLDLAINHSSNLHPWFTGPKSRDWYVWRDRDPAWPGQSRWYKLAERFYYAVFGPTLPDLNWRNPELAAEILETFRFWARQGVDGFRLDAVRYYIEGPEGQTDTPETHQVLSALIQRLHAEFPGLYFVGEAWADLPTIASYVNSGRELDAAFDFPTSGAFLESLQNETAAPAIRSIQARRQGIARPESLAPFLTNHDMIRGATALRGDPARLKLAAALTLAYPGTPTLYYGEEIGMPNGTGRTLSKLASDRAKRTPLTWNADPGRGFTKPGQPPWNPFSTDDPAITVAAQLRDPASLLQTYRQLIQLRRQTPSLRTGGLENAAASHPGVFAFVRRVGAELTLVVANVSSRPIPSFTVDIAGHPASFRSSEIWGQAAPRLIQRQSSIQATYSGLPGSAVTMVKINAN